MKKLIIIAIGILSVYSSKATIHIVKVWSGYYKFIDVNNLPDITIQLGDTVQWLPFDKPLEVHSITSTNIPLGAATFNQIWQAPADTFFQYIPQIAGLYEYECTPHAISLDMRGSITVMDGTTGIFDDSPIEEITVYPNPAFNTIHISKEKQVVAYSIYDINGRELSSGVMENKIDISELQRGVYFLEVIAIEPRILKFIKQ